MIKEYTSKNLWQLRRDYPNLFSSLPREIIADSCYIFRVDTEKCLFEFGYSSDAWILK